MKKNINLARSTVFMMVLLCGFFAMTMHAKIGAAEKLMIPVGKSTVVPANGVKKIMAVKEGIVDVLNVSDDEIILSGLGLGETQLILWDVTGRRVYDVETYSENEIIQAKFSSIITNQNVQLVMFPDSAYLKGQVGTAEEKTRAENVAKSLLGDKPLISLIEFEVSTPSLQQRIEAAIQLPNVKVSVISPDTDPTSEKSSSIIASDSVDLRIVLHGTVNNQNDYIHLNETVKGFVKDPEKQISNLVTMDNPIQVVFQAYILQVSKNDSKDLGIIWNGSGQTDAGAISFLENAGTSGNAALPKYMNPLSFKNINRFDLISAVVRAWETQGKAKVLANPKLMVYANATPSKIGNAGWFKEDTESKEETDIEKDSGLAFVNVGQDIYYPKSIDNQGNPTYEAAQASLKLLIRDMFVKDNELKFSVFAKQEEPSFLRGNDGPPDVLKRSIMTTLQIKDQQTVVLGGLINRTEGVSWKGVPILSKIPYLGRLFRSKSTSNSENELVILLTPKIMNRETDLAGKSKFETVPVPRRTDKLEKLHGIFQQIKSSHIPSDN